MRNLVTFGTLSQPLPTASLVVIDGEKSWFDLLNYDVGLECGPRQVIVKVKAFSCNYRDKALIRLLRVKEQPSAFYALGSEFTGEVISVGTEVSAFHLGDRVMANNAWYGSDTSAELKGIPTNHASKEVQVFNENALVKVPSSMTNEVAASFSISAQTSFGMIRRLQLSRGDKVLVTAASSNTSLFTISRLHHMGVQVYATSSTSIFRENLYKLGVKELAVIDPKNADFTEVESMTKTIGKFDAIVDPFFDIHLGYLLPFLRAGGRYITCGLNSVDFTLKWDAREVIYHALLENQQIMGNCLGTKSDLTDALREFEAGKLDVIIDSVHRDNVGAFIERTFSNRNRFGKVVFVYDNG